MEVSVRQHDDGTWYARPYLGRNAVTGKPLRPYKRFPDATCEAEALEMARDWAAGLSGAAALGASMRLADVLARYIDARAPSWSANTEAAYRNCLRWIGPVAGDIDVDELKPHLVEAMYNVLLLRGGRGGRALSPASVRQVHDFLCGAFRWIVASEVSPFNPMPSVAKPRVRRHEAGYLCEGDFSKLQSALSQVLNGAAGETPLLERSRALAAYLALWTGARCGEACAISVADCRLEQGTLRIGATVVEGRGAAPERRPGTKGGAGRNVSVTEGVAAEVRRHLALRADALGAALAADRELALCCGGDGRPMRPSDLSEWFSALRDQLGLAKSATFHTLRHTHATYLIMGGADMRTVQERLGHAHVSTTLGLYAHVVPGRDRQAAEAFEGVASRL